MFSILPMSYTCGPPAVVVEHVPLFRDAFMRHIAAQICGTLLINVFPFVQSIVE